MKPKEIVISGYNKIYQDYDNKRTFHDRDNPFIRRFARYFHKNAKILDAGCGSGKISALLNSYGLYVVGIDISENMLKLAKKNVRKSRFYKMDIRKLTFRKNYFDGIISLYTIIHVPRKYHLSILSKFYKILKPEGAMLISVGINDSKLKIENFHGARMYWSHFDKKKNSELLRKVGFIIKWKKIVGSRHNRHQLIFVMKRRDK